MDFATSNEQICAECEVKSGNVADVVLRKEHRDRLGLPGKFARCRDGYGKEASI
jgi:hypothetical protein